MAEEKANPKCPDGNEHVEKDYFASKGNFHYEYEGRFCIKCGECIYSAVGNLN